MAAYQYFNPTANKIQFRYGNDNLYIDPQGYFNSANKVQDLETLFGPGKLVSNLVGNSILGTGFPTAADATLLPLDANGIAQANIIPRTGTVASLQALAGGNGEISEATDAPYLIQHNGNVNGARPVLFRQRVKSYATQGLLMDFDADVIVIGWNLTGTELVNPPNLTLYRSYTTATNYNSNGTTSDYYECKVVDASFNMYKAIYATGGWKFSSIGGVGGVTKPSTLSFSNSQTDTYGQCIMLGQYATAMAVGDFAITNVEPTLLANLVQITKHTLRGNISTAASVELTTDAFTPSATNGLTFTGIAGAYSLIEISYTLLIFAPAVTGHYFIRRTTASGLYQANASGIISTPIVAPTTTDTTLGLAGVSATISINASGKMIATITKATSNELLSCALMVESKILAN